MTVQNEFEQESQRSGNKGIASEFFSFAWKNKKWWLIPLILVFLILLSLGILAGTGAAPYIYALF